MLEVLERLQRQVEEVPRAAGRIKYREPAQPGQERPVPTLGGVAPLHPRGARPGGFRAFQLGCDCGLLPSPLGEQRPDHHRHDELQDLLAVRVVRSELRALAGSRPRSNNVPRIDGSTSDQSRADAASTVSMSDRSSGSAAPSSNSPPLNQATVS